MEEKKRNNNSLRIIITVFTLIVFIIIGISVVKKDSNNPVQVAVRTVVMPVQKVISGTGGFVSGFFDNIKSLRKAEVENKELKEELEKLKQQINFIQQDKYDMDEYRKLLKLEDEYDKYEMTGAKVIAKDSGNWFHSFIIDKGSKDGLSVDMAVLAQGGLAGIITEIGPSSARVMSIIDDDSNITSMSMGKKESCMVSGDLELYEKGRLRLMYVDKDSSIKKGDKIVTSNISTKYLPGLLVGYVDEIKTDSNNITKSGTIIPYVDFSHLDTVLVIKTLKDSGDDINK